MRVAYAESSPPQASNRHGTLQELRCSLIARRKVDAIPAYIPFLIFGARLADVTLGTVRAILMVAGYKWASAALGFVELLIWGLAVGGLVAYLDNPFALISYAGGFAAGTIIGLWVEDRIALGFRTVQIVTSRSDAPLASALRMQGFRATSLDGHGRDGPVEIVLLVIPRRRLGELRRAIADAAPQSFVSIERADRPTSWTPDPGPRRGLSSLNLRGMFRK